MKKYIITIAVLFWLALLTVGMSNYLGSKPLFVVFSLVYLVMLGSAFYREFSYGYFFLAIFLWLGFWLKLIVHNITGSPYTEPIGSFNGEGTAWNEVLLVALVAAIGLIIGKFFYEVLRKNITPIQQVNVFRVPVWYMNIRRWLLLSIIIAILAIAIINMVLGIHQFGMVERTILIWPLNAVIAWLLNIGLATGVATLLWWDICRKKNILLSFFVIIIEALSSSISVLSRSIFVFHLSPQLVALYKNRHGLVRIPRHKVKLIALVAIVLFIASLAAVTTLRGYSYRTNEDFTTANYINTARLESMTGEIEQLEAMLKKENPEENRGTGSQLIESQLYDLLEERSLVKTKIATVKADLNNASGSMAALFRILFDEFLAQLKSVPVTIQQLAVNRWIGLEGVMAVQSYPNKGYTLFLEGVKEKNESGKVGMYQEISKSIYLGMDPNVWKFGSLPGAAAFLYYSGSLWIVMLGMMAFALCLQLLEQLIQMLTANPFLSSLYGLTLANTVAQFGAVPRQIIPYFFTLCCGILAIWFIQSSFFSEMLRKLGLLRKITD